MKLIILKDNIKEGLDSVGRVVGSQLNLPVLGNVLIKTDGNRIKLSATDLEIAITKTVFGKVIEEGGITVPYQTISSIINNTSSERIDFETKEKTVLKLQTDNYQATIQCIGENEFPIVPEIKKKEELLEIESTLLKNFLNKVMLAGEISDIRPEISGVLFKTEDNMIKLAATDSFRLAEGKILSKQTKNKFKQDITVTIPIKAAQEIVKIIKEGVVVRIYLEKNQALFETDETTLITRLIEGVFPDYSSIIPQEVDTKVHINKEGLINALKIASTFAGRTNDVRLKIKNKKTLEVYSGDSSIGENKYILPIKTEGPEAEVVFNWRYLLDGVRAIETKEVFLGVNGSESPAIIKSVGEDPYFYILMPIRPV
jgi:DNA polymerase-3 subunit beta